MRQVCFALTAVIMLSGLSGCRVVNCIEQWKCDHLGLCHGGRQPTLPPYPVGVAQPAAGYQAPVYPPATAPGQVAPPPTYQTPINPVQAYPPPAGNCNSCAKRPY